MAQTNVQAFSGNVGVGTDIPSSVFNTYGGGLSDGGDAYTSKVAATFQVGRGGGSQAADQGTGAILELRHESDYRHVTIESVSESTNSGDIGLRFKTTTDSNGPQERMRIDADGNVGVGTNAPHTKLNVKSGVFLSENQASTNGTVLYYDGGGSGGTDNNQYAFSNAKFGTGIFVNDTGTTGSTITLMNKEGADNTTKHASIGFVNTDTSNNGKFGGQIGFWPEDADAVKQQFRIYTSGAGAGYNLPVQQMVVTGDGNIGIGTATPDCRLHVEEPADISATTKLFHTENTFSGGSVGHFEIVEKKVGAGTGWSDFTLRLQRRVDNTEQGYIEFNPDGSSGDYGMAIGTGTVETMRIDALNGSVGIGTTNPRARFDVSVNDGVSSTNWISGAFGPATGSLSRTVIGTYNSCPVIGGHNSTLTGWDKLVINPTNQGNVGVGTFTPLRKLHVEPSMMVANNTTGSALFVDNSAQSAGLNDYSYILNAPRPGTNSGGAAHFINSAGRSNDGGVSSYNIRNDSGPLILGHNTHGLTSICGSSVHRSAGDASTITFGPNASYSSSLIVGASAGGAQNSSTAAVVTTNGNLHLDAGDTRNAYLNFYSGSGTIFGNGASGTVGIFTSDGVLGVGTTTPPENLTVEDPTISPSFGLRRRTYNDYVVYMKNTSGSFSTVTTSDDAVLLVGKGGNSNRSINALGTVNASGTDYAEYMRKSISNLDIKKGDIVGINNDGELTNVFSESNQFVVKSTNPSYVGGDSWKQGTVDTPKYPSVLLRLDEYSNISSQDANLYSYWEEQDLYANTEQLNVYYEENEKYLEDKNIHRNPYDRIAYCGQVPVNVYNTTPGQYVIPKQTDDDTISYELTNTPTFEQYQISIGKVIKIQEDGRAFIIVKIS